MVKAVVDAIVASLLPAFHPRVLRIMTEEWGERCPDFDPDCPCCKAWNFYDQYGVYPTIEQLR